MMPIVFGWLAGDLLGRSIFSRVVMTFLMWCGIGLIGWKFGAANFSPRMGTVFAILLPGSLLAWSLHRPAGSRAKIWLIEGMLVMIFAAQVGLGLQAALVAIHSDFKFTGMARAALPVIAVLALWALRAALLAWVRRSAMTIGARSVVPLG